MSAGRRPSVANRFGPPAGAAVASRVDMALSLGKRALVAYAKQHVLSLSEARAHFSRKSALGRRPSKAANGS
jgi:hypothetical protein